MGYPHYSEDCNEYHHLVRDFGPEPIDRYKQTRPEIVALCGSTRFKVIFESLNHHLTLGGKIVLGPGCFVRSTPAGADITPEQKSALDELHKRKIDLADRVLVLNVGGYIGESTRSEIEYATRVHRPIDYLEPQS